MVNKEFSIFFNLTTSKIPMHWGKDGKPLTDNQVPVYMHSLEMAHSETYDYNRSERSWR